MGKDDHVERNVIRLKETTNKSSMEIKYRDRRLALLTQD
jgi:hypothetical protein